MRYYSNVNKRYLQGSKRMKKKEIIHEYIYNEMQSESFKRRLTELIRDVIDEQPPSLTEYPENDEAKREIERLREEIRKKDERISIIEQERDDLKSENERLIEENKSFASFRHELGSELNFEFDERDFDTMKLTEILREFKEKLISGFRSVEGQRDHLERERDRLQGEVASLTNEKNRLNSEIFENKQTISNQQRQINQLNNNTKTLNADISDKQKQIDKLNSDIQELRNNIDSLNSDIRKLNQKKDKLEDENKKTQEQLNCEQNLFRKFRQLWPKIDAHPAIKEVLAIDNFEQFVLALSNEEKLENYWDKIRNRCTSTQKPADTAEIELLRFFVGNLAAIQHTTDFEVIEPRPGEGFNRERHNCPISSGSAIAQTLFPGYSLQGKTKKAAVLVD